MPGRPNPNPRPVPPTSGPGGLARQPCRLGTPSAQRRTRGAPHGQTVPLGPVSNPPGGRNLHPPRRTHAPTEDTHVQIPEPGGPPDQRPQLSPPQSLAGRWHLRPAILPGPNPNPRWRVQAPDPRGLAPNSSHAWQPQTDGRTQPLGQEQTLSLGAISSPRRGRKRHAPLSPWPLSWPLQAANPGPEEPPESRPQLGPRGRPRPCGQIRRALSRRQNPNPNPSPHPDPTPDAKPRLGAQAAVRRGLLPKLSGRGGGR